MLKCEAKIETLVDFPQRESVGTAGRFFFFFIFSERKQFMAGGLDSNEALTLTPGSEAT